MIKTIITNLSDVAKDVYRSPEYLLNFFAIELGASSQIANKDTNNPKFIINGQRTLDELDHVLDKFIAQFVLCAQCKNPETVLRVKKEEILFVCRACGHTTIPNNTHKVVKFIVKNPPPKKDKDAQAFAGPKINTEDKEEWSVDTSPEAVAKRQKALTGGKAAILTAEDVPENREFALTLSPGADPLALLKNYWASNPPTNKVAEDVHGLQSAQGWTDVQVFNLVFGSLFDANLEQNFETKANFMHVFVKGPKEQKQLLFCLERLSQKEPSVIPQISSILQEFYELDMVSDDIVFDWFEEPNKKIPANVAREVRSHAKEFMDWLQSS